MSADDQTPFARWHAYVHGADDPRGCRAACRATYLAGPCPACGNTVVRFGQGQPVPVCGVGHARLTRTAGFEDVEGFEGATPAPGAPLADLNRRSTGSAETSR